MRLLLLLFCAGLAYESKSAKVCKPLAGHCPNSNCSKETSCDNGLCQPDGTCQCHPCFGGQTCSEFVDEQYPHFQVKEDAVFIESSHRGLVYEASAVDEDIFSTCSLDSEVACPCGEVHYELVGPHFGKDTPFELHDRTGVVTVKENAMLVPGQTYTLEISASNYKQEETYESDILSLDVLKLKVVVQESNDLEENFLDLQLEEVVEEIYSAEMNKQPVKRMAEDSHPRVKRSSFGTGSSANNLTLSIVTDPATPIKPGTTIDFQIDIILPTGSFDMEVEIYVMDTVSGITTFVLCGVEVLPLPSGTVTTTNPPVPQFKKNEFLTDMVDRAIISFGTVTNTALDDSGTDYTDSTIVIKFSVTMIENADFTNATGIITAGAEYDNENYVWVSQASFSYDSTLVSFPSAATLKGPDTIPAKSVGLFEVEAYISNPFSEITVDAFTPMDKFDRYSIETLAITKGENHVCVDTSEEKLFYKSVSGLTNHRATSKFKMITTGIDYSNLAAEASEAGNIVKVAISIVIYDAVEGEVASLGVGIMIGTTQIWVGSGSFTVGAEVAPPASATSAVVSLHKSHGLTSPPTVADGQTATFSLKVELSGTPGDFVGLDCTATQTTPNSICGVQYGGTGAYGGYAPDINDTITYNADGSAAWSTVIQTPVLHATDQAIVPADAYVIIDVTVLVVSAAASTTAATVDCGGTSINLIIQQGTPGTLDLSGVATQLGSSSDWYEGSQAGFLATLTLPAIGVPYTKAILETSGDFLIDTFGARVCKVDLIKVGRGAACFLRPFWDIQNSLLYKKATPTSAFDDAIEMDLGGLCGSYIDPATEDDNSASIRIIYDVPLGQATTSTTFNLSIGVMLDNSLIWTGWADYNFISGFPATVPDDLTGTIVTVVPRDVADTIEVDIPFIQEVVIKALPGSVGRYKVTVTSSDTATLHLCKIIMKFAGNNFGCIDMAPYGKHLNPDQTVIVTHLEGNWVQEATYDTGVLRNFGSGTIYSAYPIADEDSLSFYIIGRGIAEGTASYTLTVDFGTGSPAPITIPITIAAKTKPPSGTLEIEVSGLDGTLEFYTNVMKQINVNLNVTGGYLKAGLVKITNPSPTTMTLCFAEVVWAGTNVPCVIPQLIIPVKDDVAGTIELDLGTVCHYQILDNTTEDIINIRVGVMPIETSTAESFTVEYYEEGALTMAAVTVSITKAAGNYDPGSYSFVGVDMFLVDNETVTEVEPGQKLWQGIYLRIPPYLTAPIEFGVVADSKDGQATATVHGFRWGETQGKNIGCFMDAEFYTFNLLQNASKDGIPMIHESQTDTMLVDLKYLSNTAISHMQMNPKPEDDLIMIEADILVADHEGIANADTIMISFCIKIGDAIVVLEKVLTMKKPATNNVMVLLNEFFFTNPSDTFDSTFSQGQQIALTGRMQHIINESHIEAYDARVRVLLPSYVKFANTSFPNLIAGLSADSLSINITTLEQTTDTYVEFNIQNLFFTDIIEFNVTVTVDPYNEMPKGLGILSSTALMRLVCRESLSSNPAKYCGVTKYVNYLVSGSDCEDDLTISTLAACQFHASTAINQDVMPEKSYTAGGWSPAVRDSSVWRHYITIDFEMITRVSKIVFNPVAGKRSVATYKLQTSSGGSVFVDSCPDILVAGSAIPLHCRIETRFARLVILSANDPDETKAIGVSFQWFGCYLGVPETNKCVLPPTPITTATDNWRHAAVDPATSIVYFCDYSPKKMRMLCYSSADGATWNALPSYISSIAGYDAASAKMYAWDTNKRAMVSTTDGVTWGLVDTVTQASLETTLPPPVVIPGEEKSAFAVVDIGSSWTADFDGLMLGGAYKVKWDSCCS